MKIPRPDNPVLGRKSWDQSCIVMDVDGTLCPARQEGQSYLDIEPYKGIVAQMRCYRLAGFYIIIDTGRQMRTYDGNVGLINANTLPALIAWLKRHGVPYDEIHVGRPWPGPHGFNVCDQTIPPLYFQTKNPQEIEEWLASVKPL